MLVISRKHIYCIAGPKNNCCSCYCCYCCYILRHVWTGNHPITSPTLWPQQANPSDKAWRIWRSYLAQCYLPNDSNRSPTRRDPTLRSPLGQWNKTHHLTQIHEHYINPITLQLYKRQTTGFTIFSPYKNTRRHIHYKPARQTTHAPSHSHPIDVTSNPNDPNDLSIHKQHIQPPLPISRTAPYNLQASISQLESWECELLRHFHLHVDEQTLPLRLTTDLILASDGSNKDDKGSYGWILADPDGTYLAEGSGVVYGATTTSFRCEAYGFLSAL